MKLKYKWTCELCRAKVITIGCKVPEAEGCPVGHSIEICGELCNDEKHDWFGIPLETDD